MGYKLPLISLYKLTDEEFKAIAPCDPDVVKQREPTKIKENQAPLFELCRDVSPGKDESYRQNRPWPRYIPIRTITRGGNALLMLSKDQWRGIEVALKIPWPIYEHQRQKERIEEVRPKGKIEKGPTGLFRVSQSLYQKMPRRKKREVQIKKDREESLNLKESIHYERFHHEFMYQGQMHRRGLELDQYKKYGYVPKVYDFGFAPHCFFSMEYIKDATSYMEWVQTHNDVENQDMFYRILVFVEIVFHSGGLAHCDLEPDSNIIIWGNTPVFLDFGTAKGEHVPTITLPGTQMGKPISASPKQMTDASERDYTDDIFSLGRILHSTITRRRPAVTSILGQEISGRLVYDFQAVQSLFDTRALPEKFRAIFDKTWQDGYLEISELREDYERIVLEKQASFCMAQCEELNRLKQKHREIAEILKEIIQ